MSLAYREILVDEKAIRYVGSQKMRKENISTIIWHNRVPSAEKNSRNIACEYQETVNYIVNPIEMISRLLDFKLKEVFLQDGFF